MNYETIIYEKRNNTGTITLNRPGVLNAINSQMTREIIDVCEKVTSDPEIRVVILTGAGDRAFCTGLDLKERAKDAVETNLFEKRRIRNQPRIQSHHQAVAAIDKPVIAAIRGYAVAGGLEMVLACDMRVAAADAKLGMMEVRRGRLGGGGWYATPASFGRDRQGTGDMPHGRADRCRRGLPSGAGEPSCPRRSTHARCRRDRGENLPWGAAVDHCDKRSNYQRGRALA